MFSVDDLPPKWREEAATFRRRGLEDQALFIESCIIDLETEMRVDGDEALNIPRGEGNEPLGDYTVVQIADMFQRAPQTVRDWIKSGRLRAYKLNGREYRITEVAVKSFVEQQRTGTGDDDSTDRKNTANLSAWRAVSRPASVP